MSRLVVLAVVMIFTCVSLASAKPKKQVWPVNDPTWVCDTVEKGICVFDLGAAKDEDVIRVTYPTVGTETHFRLLNTRSHQVMKFEFVTQDGYGESIIMLTKGGQPRLFSKDVGPLDRVQLESEWKGWLGLPGTVFFGSAPGEYNPTFRPDLHGRFWGRFEIMVDHGQTKGAPPRPIDVVLMSAHYAP